MQQQQAPQPQMMPMQAGMMSAQGGMQLQQMPAYQQAAPGQMQYAQYAQPMQPAMQAVPSMTQYMTAPQMQQMPQQQQQQQPTQMQHGGSGSSHINIQHPEVQKARVFVGNLATQMLNHDELRKIFGKYGQVVSISVHKGFAFVQFPDEWTARSAVRGEDEKSYFGYRIDVNIASEPKQKRNHSRAMRDRDQGDRRRDHRDRDDMGPSPAKRSRDDGDSRPSAKERLGPRMQNVNISQSELDAISTPSSKSIGAIREKLVKDYLVCGNCRESFDHIERLTSHKSTGCRVRFVCRCKQAGEPRTLDCAYCGKHFLSSWELICHCQKDHDLTVYSSCFPPRPDEIKEEDEAAEEETKSMDSKGSPSREDNNDEEGNTERESRDGESDKE